MTGHLLLFISGATALVYEVLWLRQMALVFGATAAAAAMSLAVFFTGMAIGQGAAGRWCGGVERPLRAYGLLEIAAAVLALGGLFLPALYQGFAGALFGDVLAGEPTSIAVRMVLATVVLLPPAIALGATYPVMVEAHARDAQRSTARNSLYAVNTAGGVVGALVASFILLPGLGYAAAYLLTLASSLWIGLAAWFADQYTAPSEVSAEASCAAPDALDVRPVALALTAGALTLAAEVIWTRMLVQVLHNSVYSFALVLAVVLVALAIGAAVVAVGARRLGALRDGTAIEPLFAAGAVATAVALLASARIFVAATDGLAYLGGGDDWSSYVTSVVGLAGLVILPPGIGAGVLLPLLLAGTGPGGSAVGRLVAANTLGAVAGSLVAGFVLLPALGMWSALQVLVAGYVVLGLLAAPSRITVGVAVAVLIIAVGPLSPANLRRVDVDPQRDQLLEVIDGPAGSVAAVRRRDIVTIRLNNSYTVGSSANVVNDRRKGDLPLLLHREPRSVLFLGMGAGITAAAALDHPLDAVTVCEIDPAIAEMAARYLPDIAGRLYSDPRTRVVVADARAALALTRERYDVVIGDLFVPWHAGTGSLYTVEHFRNVAARLREGGLFAQWLPMYQLSRSDFDLIARAMLEVFPRVTMWRGDLHANTPSVALFGHTDRFPLRLDHVLRNVERRIGDHGAEDAVSEALALLFYAGNLTQNRALFAEVPLNTDDQPRLEFQAPQSQRAVKSGADRWMTSRALVSFFDELNQRTPVPNDYYLARLDDHQLDYVRAGLDLYEAFVAYYDGDQEGSQLSFGSFRKRAPHQVVELFEQLMLSAP